MQRRVKMIAFIQLLCKLGQLFMYFPASNRTSKLSLLQITSHTYPSQSHPLPSSNILQMGNNACCSDNRAHEAQTQRVQFENKPIIQHASKEVQLPQPSPAAQIVFSQKHPFEQEVAALHSPQAIKLSQGTFYGELDSNGMPSGYGRFFKDNGAIYVGNFEKGKAEGLGMCVFADGSYYEGEMSNNVAESTSAHFKNASIDYQGGFHNNEFHGQGIEKGNGFEFSGQFENGKRKTGSLKWEDGNHQFTYIGGFDQNGKFTGKGKLQDPYGEYQGNFKDGQKEGFGIFHFKSRIRYEGYYKNNVKNGRGSIINCDGTIAFCGEFLNGLPHGKGYATDKKGVKHSLEWNEGVYADLL